MSFYVIRPVGEKLFEGLLIEGKKKDKIKYFSALTLEDLHHKKIFLVLTPNQFFYEVYGLELVVFNETILKIKLNERIQNVGFLMGSYEVYWKILKKEGNLYKIAYLAIEKEPIERLKRLLKEEGKAKVEGVFFTPLVLAKALSEEGILVYQERDILWILVVESGIPYFTEFLRIDELLGVNYSEIKGRITFLKSSFYRDYQKELERIYVFQREIEEGLRGEGLEPVFLETEYPEFIYAPKGDEEFNFLSLEERVIKTVIEKSYKVSLGLLGLGVLFLGATGVLFKINQDLKREIERKNSLIQEAFSSLTQKYSPEKLKAFINYVEEISKLRREPQPLEILLGIVDALEDAKITSLEVRPEGALASGGGSLNSTQSFSPNSPEAPAQKSSPTVLTYSITLAGEKRGIPLDLNSWTREFLTKLEKLVEIKDKKIETLSDESKVIFEIKGVLKKRDV